MMIANFKSALRFLFLVLAVYATQVQVITAGTCYPSLTHKEISLGTFAFTSTSYCNSGAPERYIWNFGDGEISEERTPVHSYKHDGHYNVTLYVYDKDGSVKSNNYPHDIKVSLCNYDFKIQKLDSDIKIDFPIKRIDAYAVDFGDGTVKNLNDSLSLSHKYKMNGEYTVSFYSLDTAGSRCFDTARKKVIISDPVYCHTGFTVKTERETNRAVNIETDYFAGQSNSFYEWSFGDGNTKSGNNLSKLSHHYTQSGNYTITLKTTNAANNCSNTTSENIYITDREFCYAGFKVIKINDLYRTTVLMLDSTDFPAEDSSFYVWDFGDGNKDSGVGKTIVSHQYTLDGNYNTSLKTNNSKYNCTDTASQRVAIKAEVIRGNISGTVLLRDTLNNDLISADTANIYLFLINDKDSSYLPVDTFIAVNDSNLQAKYNFTNIKPGKYILKAELVQNSKYYKHYSPTYYNEVLKWKDSKTFTITGESHTAQQNAYITLRRVYYLTGNGSISGKVIAGANKKEGDPLENILVMLLNEVSSITSYTRSDQDGNFNFNNLAYGKYEVYTEVTGLPTESALVTLSPADSVFNSVMVKVSSEAVRTEVLTGIKESLLMNISEVNIYPNPAHDYLNISFNSKSIETIQAEMFSIDGRRLNSNFYEIGKGQQTINLSISNYSKGTYILLLKNASNGQTARFRIMKM